MVKQPMESHHALLNFKGADLMPHTPFVRKPSVLLLLAGLSLFLMSCAPTLQPNAHVSFHVPAALSVIEEGSHIGIMSLGRERYHYKNIQTLLRTLSDQINRAGHCTSRVISRFEPGMEFTHLMNVDTFLVFRKDADNHIPYNRRFGVVTEQKRNRNGEVILEEQIVVYEDAQSASATMVTAVTIYRVSTLEPLAYFNIISSQDQWKPTSVSLGDAEGDFERSLSNGILERLKSDITAERKRTGVILPSTGDAEARRLILNDQGQAAIQRLNALLPQENLLQWGPKQVREWYEQQARETDEARKAGNKDAVKRNMEADLANYYLYAMAHETLEVKPATLQRAFHQYSWILSLTESDALIPACAHSLGRVELFAQWMNPTILQDVSFAATGEEGASEASGVPPPSGRLELEQQGEPPMSPEPREEMIGEVGPGQTVGGVLMGRLKSHSKVFEIIKQFEAAHPDRDLRKVRVGTKVYLTSDGQMRLDPAAGKKR